MTHYSLFDLVTSNVGATIVFADDVDGTFVLWNGVRTFNIYSSDAEQYDTWTSDVDVPNVDAARRAADAHIAQLVAEAIGADDSCPLCRAAVHYVADIGAPGIGQAWRCLNDHPLLMIGGELHDATTTVRELTIDDVR